jgi:hypothetical protein
VIAYTLQTLKLIGHDAGECDRQLARLQRDARLRHARRMRSSAVPGADAANAAVPARVPTADLIDFSDEPMAALSVNASSNALATDHRCAGCAVIECCSLLSDAVMMSRMHCPVVVLTRKCKHERPSYFQYVIDDCCCCCCCLIFAADNAGCYKVQRAVAVIGACVLAARFSEAVGECAVEGCTIHVACVSANDNVTHSMP